MELPLVEILSSGTTDPAIINFVFSKLRGIGLDPAVAVTRPRLRERSFDGAHYLHIVYHSSCFYPHFQIIFDPSVLLIILRVQCSSDGRMLRRT